MNQFSSKVTVAKVTVSVSLNVRFVSIIIRSDVGVSVMSCYYLNIEAASEIVQMVQSLDTWLMRGEGDLQGSQILSGPQPYISQSSYVCPRCETLIGFNSSCI